MSYNRLVLCEIVFQADEAATATSQSVGAAETHWQPQSRDTPPAPRLDHTRLPTQKQAGASDSTPLSSPDVLERCIVLSDVSDGGDGESAVSNVVTPPPIINSVSPPPPPSSVNSSCKLSTCDDEVTDEQETTPRSVRGRRRRKRHRRRFRRSTRAASECPSDDGDVRTEPRMPKLQPEPRVEYNPETPLRISIHLPVTGVLDAAAGGELPSEDLSRSAAADGSGEVCSTAMPVDLTSRASVVQVPPQSNSTSSAVDVKRSYSSVSSVSSSVPSPRPVYSPISSISGRSTPEPVENVIIGSSGREVPQRSVGIMASFLDRFNEMSAQQSLDFSPSQSMWTHSFVEQLAAVNRDSFLAMHNLAAPLLFPANATDRHLTEANCRRNLDNSDHPAGHTSRLPVSSSVMSSGLSRSVRHSTDAQDYVAVRPMIAAERVFDASLSNVNYLHSSCEVDTKTPVLSNGDSRSSAEAVKMNGIISSENDDLPGIFKVIFAFMGRQKYIGKCNNGDCMD